MDFRNETLYAAIRAYVAAAIEFIARKAEQEASRLSISQEDDYFAHCWTHALYESDLSEVPEYGAALRELCGDLEISRQLDANVGSYNRGTHTPSAARMMRYALGLGRREEQYVFNPGRFDVEYSAFEEIFYNDRMRCVAVAPLQGLVMEDAVVPLSNGLEVRRLIKEEMAPYRTPGSVWEDEWCAVRATYEIPKLVGTGGEDRFKAMTLEERNKGRKKEDAAEEEANDRIEDVINALRLYGMFTVYHSGIMHLTPKWLFIGSHSVPNRVLGERMITYQFGSEGDVRFFPPFWSKLENPKVKKELGTAVRRFSYSCVRHLNEDKIIDLMIAAEALFLRGTREGEKRFRLAFRAGLFLGADQAARKEVYNRMKKAYDLRSTLVHGGSNPSLRRSRGEITENDKLIGAVGDDVRNGILKAIEILSAPDAVILDDAYWDKLTFI
ncbi:MAG TPA: hypothetical protein VGB76_14160 [Pyrinomonadaceae bacterium]|jgi:hypothetical protein